MKALETGHLTHPEIPQTELTLPHAMGLVLKSFRFSQGNYNLQLSMFDYLHMLRPEWRMSPELGEAVAEKLEKPIEKLLSSSSHMQLGGMVVDNLAHATELLQKSLNGMRNLTERQLTQLPISITQEVLSADMKYLNAGRPRGHLIPDSNSSTNLNPSSDPFLSHACYYGLEENSTGLQEYDQLFQSVKHSMIQNPSGFYEYSLNLVPYVIHGYLEKHPEIANWYRKQPWAKTLGIH